jgi:hypothetical protein
MSRLMSILAVITIFSVAMGVVAETFNVNTDQSQVAVNNLAAALSQTGGTCTLDVNNVQHCTGISLNQPPSLWGTMLVFGSYVWAIVTFLPLMLQSIAVGMVMLSHLTTPEWSRMVGTAISWLVLLFVAVAITGRYIFDVE